jgi:hypothetical protein
VAMAAVDRLRLKPLRPCKIEVTGTPKDSRDGPPGFEARLRAHETAERRGKSALTVVLRLRRAPPPDTRSLILIRALQHETAFRIRPAALRLAGLFDGPGRAPSPVVPDVHRLVGRRELLRRGPGLQSRPGQLNCALAVSRSAAEPIGSPPGK